MFSVSEWAVSALQWACGADLIDEKPGGYLNPKGGVSRAEAAAVLQRLNNAAVARLSYFAAA